MENLQVSVIIPTLNRKSDLEKTFISISKCDERPFEIIIIDQSDNNETKEFCQNFKKLNIRYFYTNIKSSALARNI
ncbi:glycosyltransferase family 2 protein [bacterium]|nr:glycosyltransferase family 2 protein [bacterium]